MYRVCAPSEQFLFRPYSEFPFLGTIFFLFFAGVVGNLRDATWARHGSILTLVVAFNPFAGSSPSISVIFSIVVAS